MSQKTTHLFEDHMYMVDNHSVARNPMFASPEMQQYFIEKMEKYLKPISQIIGHTLNDNEFQILLKLKPRADFEAHFLSKQKEEVPQEEIPESTYIFSKAMSDLQVSFVKHFNYVYNRSGSLMARRFGRELVETEADMKNWIKLLNGGVKRHKYAKQWSNNIMNSEIIVTSSWLYGGAEVSMAQDLSVYLNGLNNDLGACFENLPPYRLPSSNSFFQNHIFRIFRQNRSPKE